MTDTIWAWSQTPLDNDDADSIVNLVEGMPPSDVNNAMRAIMARVAEVLSDLAPKRASTNSGNDYSVASDAAGATYRDGETISFIVNAANTSQCRLNVAGRGFVPWRPKSGVEFNSGDLVSGQPVTATWRSATNEFLSTGTGYHVSSLASGISVQSITARMPQIGDLLISLAPTPGPGRIRLTETTQAITKSLWPELDAWLAARSYPWGSTATTFNLPPAAGYFLRFAPTTTGVDPAGVRSAGATQTDQNLAASIPINTLSAATTTNTTTNTTTSTTTSTTVGVTTNTTVDTTTTVAGHTHQYGSAVVIPQGSGGAATVLQAGNGFTSSSTAPAATSTSTANSTSTATAASTSNSTSSSVSSSTSATTLSGSLALPGGTEVRTKNVAYHCDIVASTALSATQTAVFGFPYQWDTGVAASNPGTGRVRGNNATLASITQLYVSATDGWGTSIASLLASFAVNQTISLSLVGAQSNRLVARLTGTPINNTGWYTLPVAITTSNGSFPLNGNLALEPLGGIGAPGATGASGVYSFDYTFDTGLTDADPGAGRVRANSGPLGAATFLYISETDRLGVNQAAGIQQWDDSTDPTTKGWITLIETATPANRARFRITGAITDAGTYDKVPVVFVSGVAGLTGSANVAVLFEAAPNAAPVTSVAGRTGAVTLTLSDLPDVTAFARTLLDDVTAAAAAATLGLGTSDSPQFAGLNIGHASDTTITRVAAGDIAVEGNAIYRAGGTDVPIADGGTGASTAAAGFRALAEGIGSTQGQVLYRDGTQWVALPPGTSGQFLQTGGAGANPSWATPAGGGGGGRESLTAPRTYFVRGDGSDTNTGLANSAGGAFATLQKAYDTIAALDLRGFTATIKIGHTVTLTAGLACDKPLIGGTLVIEGDTTTPSNTVVHITNGQCFEVREPITVIIQHLTLRTSTSGHGVLVGHAGARVTCVSVHSQAIAGYCFYVVPGQLSIVGNYSISGSQQGHYVATDGGGIRFSLITVTLTGTPNFSLAFAYAASIAAIATAGVTFSGAATGQRYNVSLNSVIQTFGGGANYFPGSVAGTASTGGQYA